MNRYFSSLLFCFLPFSLFSQANERPRIEVTAGASDYYTFSDFDQTVFTRNGQAFSRSSGNVAEGTGLVFLRIGLAYPVSNRWSLEPYAELHTGGGTLYEEGFVAFNFGQPEERRYTWASPNELTVFAAGVNARYLVLAGPKTQVYAGAGLAFVSRNHTYREYLEVDFSDNYDVNARIEERQTINRKVLGIPLSVGVDRQISDKLSLGLSLRLQVHQGIEDHFWSGGLRCGFRL